MRLLRSVMISLVLAACTVPGIDLETRRCPCASGYYCHPDQRCRLTPFEGDAAVLRDGGLADGAIAPTTSICDRGLDTALCNGFEGPFGDGWDGESVSMATVDYSMSVVSRGQSSFVIQTADPRAFGFLSEESLAFPVAGGWLRFSARLASTDTHEWVGLSYLNEEARGIAVIVENGRLAIEMGEDDITVPSTVDVPTDAWICIELYVAENGGTSELYLDGARIATLAAGPTVPERYTALAIGITRTETTQPAVGVFIDEVAVSRDRIPCP